MARISPTERKRIGRVRPELWEKLLGLNDAANEQLGFTIAVPDYGGYRSVALQTRLYNDALEQGGGTDTAYAVATPGRSRHNYGAAFDVHIVAGGSNDDGSGTDADYHELADLGESIGLTAGYYFAERGVGKKDPFHFQLSETLQESIDRWKAMQTAGIVQAASVALFTVGMGLLLHRGA